MEITKQGAQILRMEMRNAESHLKGATVGYLWHAAACSKIAWASVKVEKTRLLPPGSTHSTGEDNKASFQLITCQLSVDIRS